MSDAPPVLSDQTPQRTVHLFIEQAPGVEGELSRA